MTTIMRWYALLDPVARARVHAYVSQRIDSLPVIAAVGGGTAEDHPVTGELFEEAEDHAVS